MGRLSASATSSIYRTGAARRLKSIHLAVYLFGRAKFYCVSDGVENKIDEKPRKIQREKKKKGERDEKIKN